MRHGFLLIDKPVGPTSHDVVFQVRRILGESKIGHLGTLDPLASGLLVLAVGAKALKVVELYNGLSKEYLASVRFGAVSATFDAEGPIEELPQKSGWLPPDDASRIQALLDDHFTGKIAQRPPAFSAVHVGGERAYRKAMRGESVELQAREVQISECRVVHYAYPVAELRVSCESGTYIRSLAHDLGQTMRCGAYLSALRRTRVGEWQVAHAVSPERAAWAHVLPLKDVLSALPSLALSAASWEELRHGRTIEGTMPPGNTLIACFDGLPVALLECDIRATGRLKPRKVL